VPRRIILARDRLTKCEQRFHVKWVPCHHGMGRPQVADRGDGLQIWRVAANILNKQSLTADRGDYPAWGLDGELTTTVKNCMLRSIYNRLGSAQNRDQWRTHVNTAMKLGFWRHGVS
jgi:hypothetical protein